MRFLAAAATAVAVVAMSFAGAAMPRTLAVPASSLIGISPANGFTCAVTSAGGVKCWGTNEANELGTVNSNSVDTLTPSDVLGLTSGVTAVSVNNGDFGFACALTRAGGVKCWGLNGLGDLGNGSAGGSSAIPVSVVGLTSGVKAITAGASFACALTSAGGVVCWGDDNSGELGQGSLLGLKQAGSNVWSPTPIGVVGLSSGVKAIAAGNAHACALTSGGGVECWGDNSVGQLGNGLIPTGGNLQKGLTPGAVVGLSSGVTAITAGASNSTCALIRAGGAKCWGQNIGGDLGNGSMTESRTPVDVVGLGTAAPKPVAKKKGSKGTPKTAPTTTSQAVQRLAVSFESYLAQMARDRAELKSVLTSVATCSTSPGAAAVQVAAVSAGRQRLLNAVNGFAAPTLQAAQNKAALQQSLTYSAAADRAYHDWLAQQGAHCPAANTPVLGQAQQQDKLATAAKERFVAVFNPLARRLHLRTWSANMI